LRERPILGWFSLRFKHNGLAIYLLFFRSVLGWIGLRVINTSAFHLNHSYNGSRSRLRPSWWFLERLNVPDAKFQPTSANVIYPGVLGTGERVLRFGINPFNVGRVIPLKF